MFDRLGNFVSRNWEVLLTGWIVAFALLWWVAPKWETVIYDGEFRYFPEHFPSQQAEKVFTKAFSNNQMGSNVFIVVRRENGGDSLLDEDKTFIEDTLVPRLKKTLGIPDKTDSDATTQKKPGRKRLRRSELRRHWQRSSRSFPASARFRTRNTANC